MEVSREEALLRLFQVDLHWVDHIRFNWDLQKDQPACGCNLDDEDALCIWYCEEWNAFLIECHRYLNNGLTPAELYAKRQQEIFDQRQRDDAFIEERRRQEWQALKRRGLTP